MGFFCFFVAFPFGRGFASVRGLLTNGLGLEDFLGWVLFLFIHLRTVERTSIFVSPKASQKLPISMLMKLVCIQELWGNPHHLIFSL